MAVVTQVLRQRGVSQPPSLLKARKAPSRKTWKHLFAWCVNTGTSVQRFHSTYAFLPSFSLDKNLKDTCFGLVHFLPKKHRLAYPLWHQPLLLNLQQHVFSWDLNLVLLALLRGKLNPFLNLRIFPQMTSLARKPFMVAIT